MSRAVFRGLVLAAALALVLPGQLLGVSAQIPDTAAAPIGAQVLTELSTSGEATAWVVMKSRADLGPAFGIPDWNARGRFVYERLQAAAKASQAGLVQFLATKGVETRSFWILNAVKVRTDAATFSEIAARSDVEKIIPDPTFSVSPVTPAVTQAAINSVEWGIANIHADQVWSTYGDRGDRIVVATIDTGVLYTHPAVVNQYRGNTGGGGFDHNYNWYDPSLICGNPSLAPCDNNGHGTHTMGTIVGDDGLGNQVGVAPGAKWIAAKGCESGSCSSTALLNSGQWMLAPTKLDGSGADTAKRPNLVSNSWGSSGGQTFYQAIVDAWVASGIFPVFANGNAGPGCGSVGSPGDYTNSYGVGAFDSNNAIASFSSRGAAPLTGELKPNISAPGVSIRSSWNDGGWNTISGTSMATPHVAGVVALMLSAAPALIGDIAQTRQILDQTAVDMNDTTCGGTAADNNVWGEGRIDALAAVTASPRGPTGTLTGTVRDANTSALLVGATVGVTGTSTRSTTTNASGIYTLTLPAGPYTVTGSKFAYQSSSVGVAVTTGVTTNQDLSLTPAPTHSVNGTVRDPASAPVAGARVTIDGTPLTPATTDAGGAYAFASVPEGSYSVRADPPGRCFSPATRALSVGTSDVANFDFSLAQKQDAFGYRCRVESTSFVDGVDLLALSGDDLSLAVALPFAFTFYGTPYSTANVTTNGLLSFTDVSTLWANAAIPGAAAPNTAIYPYWDDLYVDGPTAGIYTASLGVFPNRQFVIEWRNVRYFSDSTRRVSFEVILNENGDVQTMYKEIAAADGLEMGNSATVGIENQAGTVALQYSYNEAALTTGLAVRYYIPSSGGNVAPVANPDPATTNEDVAVTINVLGNDTDANGDPLTVAAGSVSVPAHGTATIVAGGILYTPAANYNGSDSFTYRAWDGALASNLATVNVTVTAVNDAPTVAVVVLGGTSACLSDTIPSGRIALLLADVDSPTLTLTATSSAVKVLTNAGITLGGLGADRTLTATGIGAKGNSTITVTVSDSSLTATLAVRLDVGTNGTNTMNGTSGPDMLFGLAGNDTLRGNAGADLLCGGSGNDNLTGGTEADYFSGGTGTDTNVGYTNPPDLWDGT